MKPRRQNPIRLAAGYSSLLGLSTITFSILTAGHTLAQDAWDRAGVDNKWSIPTNWVDDSFPVTTGALTFASALQISTNNDLTAGSTFDDINLTNSVAASSAAFTIAGNSIILGETSSRLRPVRRDAAAGSPQHRFYPTTI